MHFPQILEHCQCTHTHYHCTIYFSNFRALQNQTQCSTQLEIFLIVGSLLKTQLLETKLNENSNHNIAGQKLKSEHSSLSVNRQSPCPKISKPFVSSITNLTCNICDPTVKYEDVDGLVSLYRVSHRYDEILKRCSVLIFGV